MGDLQVLRQYIRLLRDHPPTAQICAEIERRLRALPYVIEASWLPIVVEDDGELMLEGVVKMLPMEELPDDISGYRDAFDLPYIIRGVQGRLPQTLAQQTDYALEEFRHEQGETEIRRAIDRQERFEQTFLRENPTLSEHFETRKELTEGEREVALVLNLILEQLNWAERENAEARDALGESATEGKRLDYAHGEGVEAGLRAAGYLVGSLLVRRQLPRVTG